MNLFSDTLVKRHYLSQALATQWLQKFQDQIEVIYLPTYAQQKYPDKYLNQDILLCGSA